ncbi:protein kinase domain-containing protein [Treponema denticola]|uniref:protein kinase domain-containing protein n=1 Tax=Treponema denticola TaxID=158 RepID=UPI0020A44F1E|nr:protein kinase [Treponema denticola]UTC82219.1 protein kinase [Treponema denticola]
MERMENNIDFPKIAEDEYHKEHVLCKKLGEGGQGFVCTTENPLIVIKFVTDLNGNLISKNKNKELFQKYREKFKRNRLLPIDTFISKPIALLNDYAGYVMQFMEDMMPLSTLEKLLDDDETTKNPPIWIVGQNYSGTLSAAQQRLLAYCQNGGLRHRLEILRNAAKVLFQLHAKGLVYCDISANNIFVTKDINFENPNVWFIDADNIFISSKDIKIGNTVFTPRFVAPEVYLRQSVCTQMSDIYAFALMVFEKLALIYPFSGEMSNSEDDWSDWDAASKTAEENFSNPMEKAYRGELDWIWKKNSSNSTKDGLPKELVLTENLYKLFNSTFTEGKKDPKARPSALLWYKALSQAKDLTIKCPVCKMSWFFTHQKKECPYCGNKLQKVLHVAENKQRNKEPIFVHELEKDKKILFTKERLSFAQVKNAERTFLSIEYSTQDNLNEIDIFFIRVNLDKEKCKIIQDNKEEIIQHQIIIPAKSFSLEIELINKKRIFDFELLEGN